MPVNVRKKPSFKNMAKNFPFAIFSLFALVFLYKCITFAPVSLH